MSSCDDHHLASRRTNAELSTYPLRLDHTVEEETSEASTRRVISIPNYRRELLRKTYKTSLALSWFTG